MRCVVTARVAVAVRVGHTAGQGGGSLAIRAGCSVAPTSVAARVLSHLRSSHSNCRQRWVVVGVEAILLDLLAALLLIVLAGLALPPEDDTGQY